MYKILVADDENKICYTISDYLTAKGFEVITVSDGKQAVDMFSLEEFDLVVLDVMMPVMNGLVACSEIRKISNVPILFLSALGEEEDFLKGFSSGADDYIVKPFPLSVLCEKIRAMILRSKGVNKNQCISSNGVTIDLLKRKVFIEEREITVSGKDFDLLRYLIENKNIVLSRDKILLRVWGYDFDGDERVVDTRIKRIRKVLGEKSNAIKTVVNVGYCYEEIS